MITKIDGRRICSCRKAAEHLGVTMAHVRQMALRGRIWSERVADKAVVLDEDEVKRLAKVRAAARAAGILAGRPPKGFKAN
jgi:Ni,Fe-hydrogenase III large subunit